MEKVTQKKGIRLQRHYILYAFLFALTFILGMLMLRTTSFMTEGDDEVYRTSFQTWGSWWNWAKAYYIGNSGRVIIHTLLICFLNLPVIVWRTAAAIMISLSCLMFFVMGVIKRKHTTIAGLALAVFTAGMFFLIPSNILANSVRWASGSLNYLFPVCMLLICMYPYYLAINGIDISRKVKFTACFALPLCANMEQGSCVLLALGVITGIYLLLTKHKILNCDKTYLVAFWIVVLCITVLSYTATGNAKRYEVEALRFVGYGMYSFPEKMILGIQLFITYLFSFRGLLIWLVPSLICFLIGFKSGNKTQVAVPAVNILLSCAQNLTIRFYINTDFLEPYNGIYWAWLVISILMFFLNAYVVILCMTSQEDKWWYFFVYAGAVVAGVVPCLSPTLYVSAGRTLYISHLFVILISVRALANLLSTAEADTQAQSTPVHVEMVNVISALVITALFVGLLAMDANCVSKVTDVKEKVIAQPENAQIDEHRIIRASIDVKPFIYDTVNWCTGKETGYDINVKIGYIDEADTITVLSTYPVSKYPVMKLGEFENGRMEVYAKLPDTNIDISDIVLVTKDHNGNQYYEPLFPQS